MSEEVFPLLYTHSVSNMLVAPNQFSIKYQYYNKQFPYLQSHVAAETSGQTEHCEGNEFLPLEREAPPCHLRALFFHPNTIAISRVIMRKNSLPLPAGPQTIASFTTLLP